MGPSSLVSIPESESESESQLESESELAKHFKSSSSDNFIPFEKYLVHNYCGPYAYCSLEKSMAYTTGGGV